MEKYLEIEKIVGHKIEDDTRYFRVKWKGHDLYAWLPLSDSDFGISCHNLILNYCLEENVTIRDLPPLSVEKRAKNLFYALSSVSEDMLNVFVQQFDNMVLPESQLNDLMRDLMKIVDVKGKVELTDKQIEKLRERVLTEKCIQLRREQIMILQKQEWKMNTVCDNQEPLRVQNNRDFAVLPDYFVYVNGYVPGEGITVPTFPPRMLGCENANNVKKKHKCTALCACMKLYKIKPAYDKHGLVIQGIDEIHECNRMCKCDYDCRYRVVQRGCTVKLLIFRSASGSGWGVKTLEFLPKGKFIGLYVGKVILWEEAENLPTDNGRTEYLFDIDFNKDHDGHSKYTVDAYKFGNFTRFINHSCVPNLKPYNVWINSLDKDLHEIAFFTIKSIDAGEELTFNYRKVVKDCKCGSFKCVPRKK